MKEVLKDFLQFLGIKGRARNHSSVPLWVIETTTNHPQGPPIAHCLQPGKKSPADIDSDGYKRMDSASIHGHGSWWKITDVSTADIFTNGQDLLTLVIYESAVAEDHFGTPIYKGCEESWGEPIIYITGVIKDKKGATVGYRVDSIGEVSKGRAVELVKNGTIDNAVLVTRNNGSQYLRSYPGQKNFEELS